MDFIERDEQLLSTTQGVNEFIAHLCHKGSVLPSDTDPKVFRRDALSDVDWAGLTKLTPTAFADELASFYRCPRAQRSDLLTSRFAGDQLSRRFLKERKLYPYLDKAGGLTLAVASPIDDEEVRSVEIALQKSSTITVATADDISSALATLADEPSSSLTAPENIVAEDDLDDLRDLARGAPVVRALDDLLRLAVEQRATDLHIEPFGDTLQVRLRIDGMLRNIPAPPMNMARAILSRLKVMAGLNITERRLPQDGRARITIGGSEIDLRVATIPTMEGESAVVRLLRKGSGLVAIDQLGLSQKDEQTFRRTMHAPFGMIIVTGPTGSGKTTTLAASLALINDSSRKILTIEDPIEYRVRGVNQTQIHPGIGLTFSAALRSFLRHDPDVIMVGEMRDAETANIGVHASLTGHLVLTTLHTNTAAGAITRLIDMGVESFLLSSTVRAIIGQRLIRILCEQCKKPCSLSADDLQEDTRYSALGFGPGDLVHRPVGCEWCGGSGFRGRKGVFEVLEVTPRIRQAIGPKTDAIELERVARSEGMTGMIEDGIKKCRAGFTTIEEIYRVTSSL